jgi:hypothetical protein
MIQGMREVTRAFIVIAAAPHSIYAQTAVVVERTSGHAVESGGTILTCMILSACRAIAGETTIR